MCIRDRSFGRLCSTEGKDKFTVFPLLATHDHIAPMQVYDGAYDIKPQPHAVFVEAPGFIGLIKPLKHLRHLLFGDAVAAVLDPHKGGMVI